MGETTPSADAYILEKTDDVEKGASHSDDPKIKFINGGQPGENEVIANSPKNTEIQFAGMDKEELMQYANDPFWKKLRLILFICFWLVWVIMLVAAILIIVLAPKCPPKPDLDWYQKKAMYQVYTRSFKDTDGNGIGDIKGIESKLPYLKDLGVGTIIISPIYESGVVDFGYDVINHTAVHSSLGTMEDFESLVKATHKKSMKLVLDFIPNHTSDKHKWFLESSKAATNAYSDYYVWDGNDPAKPPSNWRSKYSKNSAWSWNGDRKKYYYHTFFSAQPELNLRNKEVMAELEAVLEFWMQKGVDGFRFGGMSNLIEATPPADEASNGESNLNPYDNLDHSLTLNQDETFNVTVGFRKFLDSWYAKGGFDQTKLMLVEAFGEKNDTNNFYGSTDLEGAHLVFNYDLFKMDAKCDGICFDKTITDFKNTLQEDAWATWMLSNHDNPRMASRMNSSRLVNVMNTLVLTLPGTPILYYGDEIGMRSDSQTAIGDVKDLLGKNFEANLVDFSRDPSRSPMQWTSKYMAGFTNSSAPWLPVNADYIKYNVKSIDAHGASINFLDVIRQLSTLREEPAFAWGQHYSAEVNTNIYSYVRKAEGHPAYLVALNVGQEQSSDDYTKAVENLVAQQGEVVFSSFEHSEFALGTTVKLNNVLLRPGNAVVFKFL